jgi:K+-transporting ATPase c subunit
MSKSGHAQTAIADRQLAQNVAQHKSMFFAEKDTDKNWINYTTAVSGGIQLVPQGAALESLTKDYFAMLEDGLLQSSSEIPFSEIMDTCADLESAINSD